MTDDGEPWRPTFKEVLGDKSIDDFKIESQARFEEAVVELILKRYGVASRVKWDMLNRHEQLYGFKRLTLTDFHTWFPGFPVRLFAVRLEKMDDDKHAHRLFEKLPKLRFVKEFDDLAEERGETYGQHALVVHWPYLKTVATRQGGALVVHDNLTDNEAVPGARLVHRDENRAIVLEPLWRFLAVLESTSSWGMEQVTPE